MCSMREPRKLKLPSHRNRELIALPIKLIPFYRNSNRSANSPHNFTMSAAVQGPCTTRMPFRSTLQRHQYMGRQPPEGFSKKTRNRWRRERIHMTQQVLQCKASCPDPVKEGEQRNSALRLSGRREGRARVGNKRCHQVPSSAPMADSLCHFEHMLCIRRHLEPF